MATHASCMGVALALSKFCAWWHEIPVPGAITKKRLRGQTQSCRQKLIKYIPNICVYILKQAE